jgi:hypothetical protein
MAIKIAERSTWWTQTGGSNPDPYGDWRYYWIISYEQTDNDKSLNRSKVIVDYYIQTHCTNYTANSVYPGVPEGTSNVYIDDSLLGGIWTEFGKALEKGDNWKLTYLGQKSKYVTHNSDGTRSFTWRGEGLGKGTSTSTYTLPTIAQSGGDTPSEPGDDVEFTPDTITTEFYTGGSSDTMSRMRIYIDSITINDNNTMTIKYGIEAGSGNVYEYKLAAYASYINGSQKAYVHPNEDYSFVNSSWFNIGDWTWYRLNTYEHTIPVATSFKMKVKGMFNYGWTQSRWDSNTGCVIKEDTIYVTIPVKPEYNALIKTANGWKKGFTYIKIGEEWRECDIYYKVGSTWKRGSTE